MVKCNRFDYAKYDADSIALQNLFKGHFQDLETLINCELPDSRWKSLLLTELEFAYMCVGKAIRDIQVEKDGKVELEKARGND
jgi:hypothetical protein